ncbi:MAG: hypothetical protein AAGJ95_11840 [Cyanobacteria bacterium J06554_11]
METFQPTTAQLERLPEAAYAGYLDISRALLEQAEQASSVDVANVPEDEREDAIADLRREAERQMDPAVDEVLDGGTLAQFEKTVADAVSTGLLLALLLAFGGSESIRQSQTGRSGVLNARTLIDSQLRALRRNAERIGQGQLSERQIRDIPRRRSLGIRSGFSSGRILERMGSAFHNEGIRRLTSAHPCPDCPNYERLDWVSLDEIVPVATYCVCGSNCKCQVTTRFNPQRALQDLLGGNLLNQVQRRQQSMLEFERDYLRRHNWLYKADDIQ